MTVISREFMISELNKAGYKICKVKGGVSSLEEAPFNNLCAFYYRNLTGRRSGDNKKIV